MLKGELQEHKHTPGFCSLQHRLQCVYIPEALTPAFAGDRILWHKMYLSNRFLHILCCSFSHRWQDELCLCCCSHTKHVDIFRWVYTHILTHNRAAWRHIENQLTTISIRLDHWVCCWINDSTTGKQQTKFLRCWLHSKYFQVCFTLDEF